MGQSVERGQLPSHSSSGGIRIRSLYRGNATVESESMKEAVVNGSRKRGHVRRKKKRCTQNRGESKEKKKSGTGRRRRLFDATCHANAQCSVGPNEQDDRWLF